MVLASIEGRLVAPKREPRGLWKIPLSTNGRAGQLTESFSKAWLPAVKPRWEKSHGIRRASRKWAIGEDGAREPGPQTGARTKPRLSALINLGHSTVQRNWNVRMPWVTACPAKVRKSGIGRLSCGDSRSNRTPTGTWTARAKTSTCLRVGRALSSSASQAGNFLKRLVRASCRARPVPVPSAASSEPPGRGSWCPLFFHGSTSWPQS